MNIMFLIEMLAVIILTFILLAIVSMYLAAKVEKGNADQQDDGEWEEIEEVGSAKVTEGTF